MHNIPQGKKAEVRSMFNSIAHRYDFLNHFLSLGIDNIWRKKLVNLLKKQQPLTILDIATGTADLAIAAAKIDKVKIIGVDISEEMIKIATEKVAAKNLEDTINLAIGDSETLTFHDNHFDAVMVAFGVRNFEDLEKGLREFYRVLKPGGCAYILEFSSPQGFIFKPLFNFYFRNILPFFGRMISKDVSAYDYLPKSVGKFPAGEEFLQILSDADFKNTTHISLTFGVASIYLGYK
ncbi:MAG: bifunctional demethylmenaquinone methyltransferase/2-methoxy-6-polyprenyl-1,4-benzoquinol methylase UbiE [Bacteroidales bacterium]|nr:bifunctional demethylmenaquinone methyltransferase/2-methoxy-6-polyprenyl-1,4-benzoquinol methylase UbiE [Bacteroidales bacterium]